MAAGTAMAMAPNGHGHAHRRHHVARNQEVNARAEDANVNVVITTKTLVHVDVVTVYATATAPVAPAETMSSVDTKPVVSASVDDSMRVLDVVPTTISTSTTTTTSTTTSTTTTTTTTTTSTSTSSSSTTATTTTSSGSGASWTSVPSDGDYSTDGFGERTNSSGSGIEYTGNVGSPWGSNIIEVTADNAYEYKYVVQFTGSNTNDWFVSFWNKIGPDGKMDGWYGHSALNFTLAAGETKYVAFDENSQGGWGAAEGDSLPTDEYGGYACTWGEFDFGDTDNDAWSGWDVSAIQAQNGNLTVQGMKICQYNGDNCSYITTGAAEVVDAYTAAEASVDGIGGTVSSGAVRLVAIIDYSA
ncbi:hypothetical protein ARAM_000793 [Aspergillus rambellii]|uniref:Allergen Asp f 4 n=1 Tax=Aspergillus rambellii TaxID=308745 RepID=A0A0F8U401_9EURO|nr:hypothetical protein ARAM_000793 [Aspergillus rambellii]